MTHIPIYRFGEQYESLSRSPLASFRGGEPLAEVSQANAGLIRRDLKLRIPRAFDALQSRTSAEMIAICREAGRLFLEASLPAGVGTMQSPEEYVGAVAATCGLPHVMGRANMEKIHHVFTEMPSILGGLTRGMDPGLLDGSVTDDRGRLMSFHPATTALGVVLPSNSPGVNSLWIPAVAMRVPVVLKPGREDPWTPWRIWQALRAAGCPPEAVGFYPTDHEGSATVIEETGRVILFGDQATIDRYADQPAVSVHGPGYSKVLVGEDRIEDWPDLLPLMEDSVAANSGRSCVNASTIVVPRHGREIAEALATRLAARVPAALDDEFAALAAFVRPEVAAWTDQRITELLKTRGAEDCSTEARAGKESGRGMSSTPRHEDRPVARTSVRESHVPRLAVVDGMTFLLPTIVYCKDREHPLARTEFLMPYAAVVEMPQAEMLDWIGDTLVGSVVTEDAAWRRACMASAHIDRLNLGEIATPTVRWDQPHEGNLFEFLYRRRAIQVRMPA